MRCLTTADRMLVLSACAALVFTCGAIAAAGEGPASEVRDAQDPGEIEFFEKKIRPVLIERCFKCHSAQAAELQGGLHLDSQPGMLAGGDSGPAIVPGDPEGSPLIQAIRYTDAARQMPPDGPLSADELAAFEAWVSMGAPDPRHEAAPAPATTDPSREWAFQPLSNPSAPQVQRAELAAGPIDRFLLARLEERGLGFSPAADKPALLRRATFDLLGLPPTPGELEAFLADSSPEAFAKVVDRLLAARQYGECWGRHWLDLVRYTDDLEEAWRYRDWVVDAFNRDLPYDQFIQQQIAGDLLPTEGTGPNAQGIVATTMLSIGQWSGLDRKKRLTDIVDDQIDAVSRSFMGLTVACARCHNHKFDPITTADYYGVAGIFLSSRVISNVAYLSHGTHRLRIPLVPQDEVEKHQRLAAEIERRQEQLEAATDDGYRDFAKSLVPETGRYLTVAWQYRNGAAEEPALSLEEFASQRGLHSFALAQWVAQLEDGGPVERRLLEKPAPDYDGESGVHAWMAHAERPWWAANSTDHDVPIETFLLPPRSISVNPGTEGGAVGWKSPIAGTVRISGWLADADPLDGAGVAWILDHRRGEHQRELSWGSMPNGGTRRLDQGGSPERLESLQVQPGDMIYLQVWLREGDAHYDITSVELSVACTDGSAEWNLARDVVDDFLAGNPHGDRQTGAEVWHFYDMRGGRRRTTMPAAGRLVANWRDALSGSGPEPPGLSVVEQAARQLQDALDGAAPDSPILEDLTGPRSPFWVSARDDTKYLTAEAQAQLARQAAELESLKSSLPPLPAAHGIEEGGIRYSLYPGVQDVPIHVRGSYEQLGEPVARRFPRALAGDDQPPILSGSGRLELARWIASPDHPLTARVMVNRLWQHHFGEGIVRTPSNFGATGERPTHPELLDFLARRFVESGWSIKSMHRRIMLSAAYQQGSRPAGETWRADPENRLFGRMNRRRMEAEAIHDSLLAVAGNIDLRPGGPPDRDVSSRRRMLYLATSRTDRSGFGAVFDAANPSIHIEKRTASIVAPQALYLMNGELVVQAARGLAGRAEAIPAAGPAERIAALYGLVYGRRPTEAEVMLGIRFVERAASEPPGAASPGTPELTPWEVYAQALILSNEFLFVD